MKTSTLALVAGALSLGVLTHQVIAPVSSVASASAAVSVQSQKVAYKTVKVGEVDMFYRESGPKDAPVVLLLHGFPTSSHMYRNLIPQLSGEFRVIAPDYPGFGSTKAPPRGKYDYTFDNLYKSVEGFTEKLGLDKYALFVFDYGAPVGYRLAAANPEKVTALISSNGNAYDEGLAEAWGPIQKYWREASQENRDALRGFLKKETTHFQYTHGVPKNLLNLVSPDAIAHDQAILDREPELQLDLFRDYRTNVALYPEWQKYFRQHQPPFLAVWGNKDPFFLKEGAEAYKRDIKNAEVHIFPTGHFALETHGEEIGALTKAFLIKTLK